MIPTRNVITIIGKNTQTRIFGSISNSVILNYLFLINILINRQHKVAFVQKRFFLNFKCGKKYEKNIFLTFSRTKNTLFLLILFITLKCTWLRSMTGCHMRKNFFANVNAMNIDFSEFFRVFSVSLLKKWKS